ncbi:MAG: hypothetical protein O7F74_03375 [Bacteroidetes bacterium]|nr:hypothetical protein [Bacteroidota bacterium]
MDLLKSIVESLSGSQQKDFRKFIQSQKKLSNRKDLELFDLLAQAISNSNPGTILYNKSNQNAYHAVRRRLTQKLGDFLVLKRLDEDITSSSSVMGMISMARYFIEQSADELAWHYINKAESKAGETDQFDLLNTIYLFQIEHAYSPFASDLNEIIKRMTENKKVLDEDERTTIACGLIRKELQKIIIEGKDVDFESVIQIALTTYNLANTIIERPKVLYSILSITRSSILAKKDFYSFEPYIIQHFEKAKNQYGFSRNDHFYKISILYMIAHVLYRNRKFESAEEYLVELNKGMQDHKGSHLKLFHSKYILLLAAVKCYQGHLNQAVLILEESQANEAGLFTAYDKIKLLINLSIYYFQKEEHRKAFRTANSIGHTDKWYEKNLGKEWVFKKNLMEILLQIEAGNDDIALSRIRWFEKTYGALFTQPLYSRAKIFLHLIKIMIKDPEKFKSQETKDQIEHNLTVIPEEQEDLQAMAFYAWLKSKVLKSNYYEVLLNTVKPEVIR